MDTSFRFPPDKMTKLELLANRLCKSKAEVILQAVDKLYEEELYKSGKSLLDVVLESGFSPMPGNLGDIAADEQKQRKIINQRLPQC